VILMYVIILSVQVNHEDYTVLDFERLNFCISSENVSPRDITFLTGKTKSIARNIMKPKILTKGMWSVG
jgi:hypothetical protein